MSSSGVSSTSTTMAERLILGLDWMERSIRYINDIISDWMDYISTSWTKYVNTESLWNGLIDYWYIVVLLVFFWPVWMNLVIALATASGWLFWLVASILLGCLQVIYATYQFICIALDIFILSILKTFAMLRTQILQLSITTGLVRRDGHNSKKSRRREWKDHISKASTYNEFCSKLSIDEPSEIHIHQCHKNNGNSSNKRHTSTTNALSNGLLYCTTQIFNALIGHADHILDNTVDEKDLNQFQNDCCETNTNNDNAGTTSTGSPSRSSTTTRETTDLRKSKSCIDFSPQVVVTKKLRQHLATTSNNNENDNNDHDDDGDTSSETSDSADDSNDGDDQDNNNNNNNSSNKNNNNADVDVTTGTAGMLSPSSNVSMTPPTPPVVCQSTPSSPEKKIMYSPSHSFPLKKSVEDGTKSSNKFRSAANLLTVLSKSSRDAGDSSDDDIDDLDNVDRNSHEYRMYLLRIERELGTTGCLLIKTTERLKESRLQAMNSSNGDTSSLKFLLTGVVKRNHLCVDDIITEDSRSIAECGRHFYSFEARNVVEQFINEVEECLHYLANSSIVANATSTSSMSQSSLLSEQRRNSFIALSRRRSSAAQDASVPLPVSMDGGIGSCSSNGNEDFPPGMSSSSNNINAEASELVDRIKHLSKMKMNTGCSALMLSGGGAQAMYHLGTIRALVESDIWDDIPVISGTSGGSISAAMCAMKTKNELLNDVCIKEVSTDYTRTGIMSKENIRWFPTLWEMGRNWLKSRLLVDSKEFKRCCDYYFGDVTFEEAYIKTRKHVCITVSASRSSGAGTGGGGAQRLLLNHISTPHVTLSSAVAASCALPGVMKPAKLMAKDTSTGKQVIFEVDGVEWIDGSVQADLPFKRISTLFNVSNFIVAQVNFHVVPFLNKAYHPSTKSLYWKLFQVTEWDVRSRALKLAKLGLFPRIFGQDVSKVFKQKYHGNITLVPKFTMMQVFGMQVLSNPTVTDMELYIKNGQKSSWPYLNSIKLMLRLEKAIDENLHLLKERFRQLPQELQITYDLDDGSFCCGGSTTIEHHHTTPYSNNNTRSSAHSRNTHYLKVKVRHLEAENALLRKRLLEMEQQQRQQEHAQQEEEE